MTADDLYKKYPKLFRQAHLSEMESCMGRGIECGSGWFGILEETCQKLQALSDESGVKIEFAQIKEKFGTLTIYLDVGETLNSPSVIYNKAYDIVREADIKSARVCEKCGAPGNLRYGSWIMTLCDEHYTPKKTT